MKLLYTSIVVLLLLSCTKQDAGLELAFKMAGKNRAELEKVISHYAADPADSLKLKAAKFLITNMPWHYSYGGEYMEEYRRQIDSIHISQSIEVRLILYTLPEVVSANLHRIEIVPDVEVITADFLIHNIEQSFGMWENYYWLRELSFDDFCDYLLPYRLDREPLIHWKDSVSERMKMEIEDLTAHLANLQKDSYVIYEFLNTNMPELLDTYFLKKIELPGGKPIELDCMSAVLASTYFWRMYGIPSAIDVFPFYGHGNNRHSELAIIDPRSLAGSIPIQQHPYVAKVYRRTFSRNRSEVFSTKDKNSFIRYVLDPLHEDVTAQYVKTTTLPVTVKNGRDLPDQLYLALFSLGWKPIAATTMENGKAIFNDVGVGAVYVPFYYKNDEQVFVSEPFYVKANGDLHYFIPDKKETCTVELDRKYKLEDYKFWWSKWFVDGRFEAADNEEFRNAVNLFTVSERTYWKKNVIQVDAGGAARYYRFINNDAPVDLAEIHFFDREGTEVKGKLIGDSQTLANPELPVICDNDMLSFTAIESWVGYDFGQPVDIGRIEYLPRNDTNGIYPGMIYELLYFDEGKWKSVGTKKATSYTVSFDNVPKNALLWLRNLTEGKEERIFVYENGKQYWY